MHKLRTQYSQLGLILQVADDHWLWRSIAILEVITGQDKRLHIARSEYIQLLYYQQVFHLYWVLKRNLLFLLLALDLLTS